MARLFNPPHPGLTLRDDVLPALGLNVTEAAKQLDVSRVALSRLLNGRAAISPEMALRIEAWLGVEGCGEARLWLAEQSAYDGIRPRNGSSPPPFTFNQHQPTRCPPSLIPASPSAPPGSITYQYFIRTAWPWQSVRFVQKPVVSPF